MNETIKEATSVVEKVLEFFGVATTGELISIAGVVITIVLAIWKVLPFIAKFNPNLDKFTKNINDKVSENEETLKKLGDKYGKQIEEANAKTQIKLETIDAYLALMMKTLTAIAKCSNITAEGKTIAYEALDEFRKLAIENKRTDLVSEKTQDELKEMSKEKTEVIAEAIEKENEENTEISVADALK